MLLYITLQDYESDFQECTDSEGSPISEKSDSSRSGPHPEAIELQTREKVHSNCLKCQLRALRCIILKFVKIFITEECNK